MRRAYDRYNAPLASADDYPSAVRLLRRLVRLCFILAEEATESKEAEMAVEAFVEGLHKKKQGRRRGKGEVVELQRQIARRLMPRTEFVVDELVEMGVLREVSKYERETSVPEYLAVRVRDVTDAYRVFELVLPGSAHDKAMQPPTPAAASAPAVPRRRHTRTTKTRYRLPTSTKS